MPKGLDFDKQYRWASVRERGVARWLSKERGHYTLATYDFSGKQDEKAPKLYGPTTALVIPDLLAFKSKHRMWFEVKAKTEATLHRISDTWETGFNLRHFRQYESVQSETGIPVAVLFVHDNVKPGDGDGEVRFAMLDTLREIGRENTSPKMGKSGMIFFPYYRLRFLLKTESLLAVG